MGNRTTWGSAAVAAVITSGLLLSGCASASPGQASGASPSAAAPSIVPSASPSAEGSGCELAGPDAVAAVNASIAAEPGFQQPGVEPYPQVLTELAVSRYEPLDIWTLTGVFAAAGSEGGFLAVWATREDPTAQGFDAEIFSFGNTSSESESAAQVLQPGYIGEHDMDMVPPSAAGCRESLL